MVRVLVFMFLAGSIAISQGTPSSRLSVKVSVSSAKTTYKVTESIRVKYEIENVGEIPFYIPQFIDSISDPRGCVILEVSAPHGGEGIIESDYADLNSDYWNNRNIKDEVRRNWLLLKPGQLYGMTTTLKFKPLKPGHYRIVAKHMSGYVSEKEKSLLVDQDYPLLLGTHASQPLEIEVTGQVRK
jgi:hypothetical protein